MAKKAKAKVSKVKAWSRAEKACAMKEDDEEQARQMNERLDESPVLHAHKMMMKAIEDASRWMKQAGVRSVHIEDDMACITETMHVCLESGNE